MLASITPLGERGRGRRWAVSAPAYVVGSAVGGLAVGALAGGIGALLPPVGSRTALVVLAGALVAALLLDLRGRRAPGPARQVNEDWLETYREWVYGAGFGLQLGAGVLTQVSTAAVHALLVAAVLTQSAVAGAALGLTFGLVRALPVLTTAGVRDAVALRALHRRSAALERPAARATVAVLGVLAVLTAGGAA